MKLIKVDFNSNWSDPDAVYLPYQDNLDEELCDTFDELKEKWESKKWDYYNHPTVSLIDTDEVDITITTPDKVSKCDEFGVWFYDELGYFPDFYSRPFDNSPDDLKFCSYFASDCYKGEVYSKDFAYHDCESCQRTICYQNPANGWMVQFKVHDGWMECNKCAQERLLNDGVDVEELVRTKSLDGLFMNSGDLDNAGWVQVPECDSMLVGSGRFGGNGKIEPVLDKLQELHDAGKKVFVEYDSMSIGGLGGYVTLWAK